MAEEFNEKAVKAFKAKDWQLCYDLSSEVIPFHTPAHNRIPFLIHTGSSAMVCPLR